MKILIVLLTVICLPYLLALLGSLAAQADRNIEEQQS